MMYLGQDPIGINNTYYDLGIIADDYSELVFPIRKGQGCIYDKKYYIANQDINISEEWTEAHWDRRLIGEEIEKKYEKPNTGIPASDLASGIIPSVPVQDVQINGTSILDQGVANVPKSTYNVLGVIKPNGMGVDVNSNGEVFIAKASPNQMKAGTSNFVPIVPSNQHQSVFYALSKLAGVDLASGSDTVGVYPDNAKIAIQKMFGLWTPKNHAKIVLTEDSASSSSIYFDDGNDVSLDIYEELVIIIYQSDRSTHNSEWGSGGFGYITIRDTVNSGYISPFYSPDGYLKETVPTIINLKRFPNCIMSEIFNGDKLKVGYVVRESNYIDKIRWFSISANNATLYAGCTIEAYVHRFI